MNLKVSARNSVDLPPPSLREMFLLEMLAAFAREAVRKEAIGIEKRIFEVERTFRVGLGFEKESV